MDEQATAGAPRRPRWFRMIAGGVVLGLIGVAAGRLIFPADGPAMPELRAGLSGEWDAINREFAARVAARFPSGSDEGAMKSELAREGFEVSDERRARWSRAHYPCRDFAEVRWRAAEGRIVATEASTFQACT